MNLFLIFFPVVGGWVGGSVTLALQYIVGGGGGGLQFFFASLALSNACALNL